MFQTLTQKNSKLTIKLRLFEFMRNDLKSQDKIYKLIL